MTTYDIPTNPTPTAPAAKGEALNDGLAVCALIFGLFFWPLGILFGHLSNRAARAAGRKRSPLAVTGLAFAYVAADITATVILAGTVAIPALVLAPTAILVAGWIIVNRRAGRSA
jgi:peptidyl-prolyl cis-trans isomerase B (cyclophilin B)